MQTHSENYIMERDGSDSLNERNITKLISCATYTEVIDLVYAIIKEKNTPYKFELKELLIRCLKVEEEKNTYLVSITLSKDVGEDNNWKRSYV